MKRSESTMKSFALFLAVMSIICSYWGVGLILGVLSIVVVLAIEASSDDKKMSKFGKIIIVVSIVGIILSGCFIVRALIDMRPKVSEVSDVYRVSIQLPLYSEV